MASHLLVTQHKIPCNQNQTPRDLAIVTGGKAFAFSSWWDCCCISKAARRAGGVIPLILGDFHHADVRAAGYKFGWLSRCGGAVGALDEAGPAFTSWGPAVQPLPTPVQGAASAWPLLRLLKPVRAQKSRQMESTESFHMKSPDLQQLDVISSFWNSVIPWYVWFSDDC